MFPQRFLVNAHRLRYHCYTIHVTLVYAIYCAYIHAYNDTALFSNKKAFISKDFITHHNAFFKICSLMYIMAYCMITHHGSIDIVLALK